MKQIIILDKHKQKSQIVVPFYFSKNNINLDVIKNKNAPHGHAQSIDVGDAISISLGEGRGFIKNTVMTNYMMNSSLYETNRVE